jgi:hypothetical protein
MIEFILNTPLYFVEGCIGVWQWLGVWVPHYSWGEYGSLLKGFAWLIPARIAYGILFPEKVIIKKVQGRVGYFRKRGVKPSKTDHQTAAATIFDVLHH